MIIPRVGVGTALVDADFVGIAVLERSLETLGTHLVPYARQMTPFLRTDPDVPARLAAVLGALATGYLSAMRNRTLSEQEANVARATLHQVLEMFARIELQPEMLAQAGRLAGPLGTLDALHLATALVWQDRTGSPVVMATHDPELAAAAARHGLHVIGGAETP